MSVTCCHGCTEKRTATCHFDGTCEEYLKQSKANEADRKAKYINSVANGYVREQATRHERLKLHNKGFSRKSRRK